MAAGDLCKVSRKFYCHWFVEGYDNTAIHFSGTPTDKVAASVKVSPIGEVVNGGEKEVVLAADPAKAHSIVQRAMRQVGQKGYHLAFNNCEHFAKYCATGIRTSAQFNRAAVVSLICIMAGLSGGAVGVLFGAIQGPVAEAASTYLEHHTRRLRDKPEFLFLLIIIFVVMIVIVLRQRQKLSLQLQS